MPSRRILKPIVFVVCLIPFVALAIAALHDQLGANPIAEITHITGDWTLRFLLISLAVTPLRRLSGWNEVIGYRRMLGLFAYFYAVLHFGTYIVLDQYFAWDVILKDIAKRPFITIGFLGLAAMTPLAVTSTKGWIRRLGRRWQQLHRLVYVAAIAGVVHYLWLVKSDKTRPLTYGLILALLLGIRAWYAWQRPRPKAAPVRARSTAPASEPS
jgi:methionine sulfoxide reductase heme-binding subunit